MRFVVDSSRRLCSWSESLWVLVCHLLPSVSIWKSRFARSFSASSGLNSMLQVSRWPRPSPMMRGSAGYSHLAFLIMGGSWWSVTRLSPVRFAMRKQLRRRLNGSSIISILSTNSCAKSSTICLPGITGNCPNLRRATCGITRGYTEWPGRSSHTPTVVLIPICSVALCRRINAYNR